MTDAGPSWSIFGGRPGKPFLRVAVFNAIAAGVLEVIGRALIYGGGGEAPLLGLGGAATGFARFMWFVAILLALLGLVQFHHNCAELGRASPSPSDDD